MTIVAVSRMGVALVLLVFCVSACDFSGEEEVEVAVIPAPQTVAEEDYTVSESGLKYFDFTVGTGEAPASGQAVLIHYHAWLDNGVMFESSILQGPPIDFVLGNGEAIVGLEEGVTTMRVGGRRQLVIPPELAYGESGFLTVPPNATLIFEVELLAIQ